MYLFLSIEEKTGGLFDFDGTIIVIFFQTILLSIFLNNLLFDPILNVIENRTKYINEKLVNAVQTLNTAETVISLYQENLSKLKETLENEVLQTKKTTSDLSKELNQRTEIALEDILLKYIGTFFNEKDRLLNEIFFDQKLEESLGANIVDRFLVT